MSSSTNAVTSSTNAAYKTNVNDNTEISKKNSDMSTESFFKLLASQLQNQDMSNPMDNSEMMTQMTQIAMMQAMDNFSTAMDDFSQVNTINYGTSMMGKEVLVADMDKTGQLKKESGTVTRVDIFNGVPTLYLDDDTEKGYPVSNIMSVFEKGHKPSEDPDDPGASDDPSKADPSKGDPGKGDPGKADPGKGDPGKEDKTVV
ncbi:flagellar hook capping FlgD N-terminal domain-containing protein [Clostridium sp. E02]|uniref:flagellar hook assembly protein FlgD n=1 Tax=Clostridium sp. E02 TaxID=2487134 RepID=UPI0019D246B2|nr:flagellar hook capping FlgD N-terminal domain-containing protein [Clostridium sp. E02]